MTATETTTKTPYDILSEDVQGLINRLDTVESGDKFRAEFFAGAEAVRHYGGGSKNIDAMVGIFRSRKARDKAIAEWQASGRAAIETGYIVAFGRSGWNGRYRLLHHGWHISDLDAHDTCGGDYMGRMIMRLVSDNVARDLRAENITLHLSQNEKRVTKATRDW